MGSSPQLIAWCLSKYIRDNDANDAVHSTLSPAARRTKRIDPRLFAGDAAKRIDDRPLRRP
jgi:hypothetical protein